MKIVATDFNDARFMYDMITVAPTVNFKGMKAVDYKGDLQVMVGYDAWTPNSLQCHILVRDKKALTRKFLRECFNYMFITCDRELVLATITSDNTASLDLTRRLGFKEVYRVKDGWQPGVDLVLKQMNRDECKWLRIH